MVFSSNIFLFCFLPAVLVIYYIYHDENSRQDKFCAYLTENSKFEERLEP